ncbi:ABC transporter substrate-binding protein [Microlunatus parietis]|uniref:Iron complex transport system substrate-binding protein n=1 Tax=Microlunatus parietis TaxID=682979 RepID=A0A7Y9LC73_9ACTN|nr:ABC transporter substrate-binding protein [Microlunatus parietis]NYE70576.1 iron complex transport system substrate-binding protein [Microlunatus parietis]
MRRLFVIMAGLALLLTTACQGTAAPEPGADAGGAGFPVTVPTKFGDVVIPAKPQRVVALGWGDAETALALGVQPVGASDWLAFGGEGVGPWAKARYDAPPKIIGTLEPSYEEIAELAPDLILDVKSSGDQGRYDRLSKIAPTVGVPEGGDNYLTNVERQITMIAVALGVPDQGTALLADIDRAFAEAAAAHPEFAGRTITVAAYTSEGWGAYISAADRPKFLYRLGFVPNPAIEKEQPERFSVRVSDERLDLLDGDLLIVQPIGKTAADVEKVSTFKSIPAVRDGRYLILDAADVRSAFSLNSPLSIKYAIDTVTPLLAAKLSPGQDRKAEG